VARVDCTASGDETAISVASSIAFARTSGSGTSRSTSPMRSASSPPMRRPV
jgi:hypothetical protein